VSRRTRRRSTGRRESGSYLALPHAVIESENFCRLSTHAVKLLVNVGAQYRGNNNGDLCATWNAMKHCGWRSRDTLCRALAELLYFGLLERTRQGGLHCCSLYALTWAPIDECHGKLDIGPTFKASGLWKIPRPPMPKRVRENASSSTVCVSIKHGTRVKKPFQSHRSTRRAG
jgi:hypothetical protein